MGRNTIIVRFGVKEKGTDGFLKALEAFGKKAGAPLKVISPCVQDGQPTTTSWGVKLLSLLAAIPDLKIPGYAKLERTQEGLANAMELDRSVVSRHLKDLQGSRFVKSKTLNIIGESRKRKAYFITQAGKEFLEANGGE